ncbi:PhzF family phenazine biosynthesis protein [Yoonia sp. BS5-3]|uniref:PhzF family phenazine biosynthesis protein n=1 Tax=Yoonia phaeophyticola TaxID=3137369 RepID=A0ABZ2V0T9_9RHOB
MTKYVVYDVFTENAFGGNQLAVIPDATQLAEDDLQKIAREFNFSEVTFVYPPTNPGHTAKVRIFTPTMEVPFAGHPTIGTAIALRDLGHAGDMVMELGVGPIPCTFDGDLASFTTSKALELLDQPDPALVAEALGLTPGDLKTDVHVPQQASLGLPFVICQLQNSDALNRCSPSLDAIKRGAGQHPVGHDFSLYAYVCEGDEIQSRMFAPLDNIPEDPATGSAAATLAALLTEKLGTAQTLNITQGTAMGRPSQITATTDQSTPVAVTIHGQAVKTMQGELVF